MSYLPMQIATHGRLLALGRNDDNAESIARDLLRKHGGDGIPFVQEQGTEGRAVTTLTTLKAIGVDRPLLYAYEVQSAEYLPRVGQVTVFSSGSAAIILHRLGASSTQIGVAKRDAAKNGVRFYSRVALVFLLLTTNTDLGHALADDLGIIRGLAASELFSMAGVKPIARPTTKPESTVVPIRRLEPEAIAEVPQIELPIAPTPTPEPTPIVDPTLDHSFAVEVLQERKKEIDRQIEELQWQAEKLMLQQDSIQASIEQLSN